jgi:YD repeat-containing protein
VASLPKTPETFIHDPEGNLTQDGRWTYIWDGENRLIRMETLPGVPAAAKRKLEFAYENS